MFQFSSIANYHAQLIKHTISCEDVVQHYITQTQQQQHLNAFIEVYQTEALQQAKILDEKRKSGKPMGKLHGVVLALKDVICYKNHTVTAG